MKPRLLALALILLASTSCDRAPKADPERPDAYALQARLEPAAGGSLQRLTLPAPALVAMKRFDLSDVRVFDSRGKVVPLALVDAAPAAAQHSASVPVYPVIGPAGVLGKSALSIRVESNTAGRVVTVASSSQSADSTAPPAAALLDTHDLRERANAITLDAAIPVGQPVTVTLLTSANLKDWEPLAEKVLFRPGNGPSLLGGARIALPGVDLHDRYVGVSWGNATGVALKGASITTSAVMPPARISVATSPIPLTNAHELRFDLPTIARLAAIRLTETGPDGLIPIKLYGRNHDEALWTLLSAATLRPGSGGTVLDLSGPPMASYRVEADQRTAGFDAPPRMELLFDPVELLVSLSGTPPYHLAAGQAAASPRYLTIQEIAPQGIPSKLADLPQARIVAPSEAPQAIKLQASKADGALAPRKLMLWAALLLGTLVLAFAAIRLLRETAVAPDTPKP